mgnify:CR=1 FL=1
MAISTRQILDVLRANGISPEDSLESIDLPGNDQPQLPGIGEVEEGETIYTTSINEVMGNTDDELEILDIDDPRVREWLGELERIIGNRNFPNRARQPVVRSPEAPEPHCAWYCPIHYFGHGWGIYIRESCVLSLTKDIATFVDWSTVKVPLPVVARQLLRSAFYVFFLHEQFHHKVESLGFRLLVSTGTDRYRPYKANVYRRNFMTADCLEESLANAESYRRLNEQRYADRIDPGIRKGLRNYIKTSMSMQPPGYREGVNYLTSGTYKQGLYELQSQILDGRSPASTPKDHWSIAPNMITSLSKITDEIYVVMPRGARPIFTPTAVDPGATVSSRELEKALKRYHGYETVPGGKGSHLKLKKAGADTVIIPGERPVLSPGVVKHALSAIGGYPLSRLPDLLSGKLEA